MPHSRPDLQQAVRQADEDPPNTTQNDAPRPAGSNAPRPNSTGNASSTTTGAPARAASAGLDRASTSAFRRVSTADCPTGRPAGRRRRKTRRRAGAARRRPGGQSARAYSRLTARSSSSSQRQVSGQFGVGQPVVEQAPWGPPRPAGRVRTGRVGQQARPARWRAERSVRRDETSDRSGKMEEAAVTRPPPDRPDQPAARRSRPGCPRRSSSQAAAGVPKNARWPPVARTATLSQRAASSGCCVVSTTVVPRVAQPAERRITSVACAGSRPTAGSSRKSSAGSASSSAAMAARLRWPASKLPDPGGRAAGQVDRAQRSAAAPSRRGAPRSAAGSAAPGQAGAPGGCRPRWGCIRSRPAWPTTGRAGHRSRGRRAQSRHGVEQRRLPDPLPPMIAISSP